MDNGSGNPPASDQSQKKLSISLAASSMINASDMITAQVYQDNLKRIQEVREMVQRLEVNNETAHKNFLIDQLEKRVKEGRDAEDALARLRNQAGLLETVQFSSNAPTDKSEVVLPTTATLVEMPESHTHSSHSSVAPATAPHPRRIVQPSKYQWSSPQVQPYYGSFRYQVPPPVTLQPPPNNAMLHTHASANENGWFAVQNRLPHSGEHGPPVQMSFQSTQAQQPQSWSGYRPVTLSTADTVSGYNTMPTGWARDAPTPAGPSTIPSHSAHHGSDTSTQSTSFRPPVADRNQAQNPSSWVQGPLQGIPTLPVRPSIGRPPAGSRPVPAESQPRPVFAAASRPMATSKLQQHQPRSQRLPDPQSRFQQQQPQLQRPPQPLSQFQQHSRPFSSQQPSQPPQTHQQIRPSTDRAPSTNVSQPSLPVVLSPGISQTQSPQPAVPPERERQKDIQNIQVDQATFIKLFQSAVQHGILELKAFWFQAKASGIADEWFRIAINSLPRDVWQSVLTQHRQSEPAIPGLDASVVSSPVATAPPVQTVPTTRLGGEPGISSEGSTIHSAPEQGLEQYAVQVQYYAGQATKTALSAQAASISSPSSANIAPTQAVFATPRRDESQARADVRTPKDANKLTLARDILRALGKTAQKSGDEPADQVNNHESDELPEVTSVPISHLASDKSPAVPLEINSVDANSLSHSSANEKGLDKPQHAAPSFQLMEKSVLKDKRVLATVIKGPAMIDLTLDDSGESIDGDKQAPTLMRTSTSGAASSQPTSPANIANHTPLFENLSMAELPLDVAVDSNRPGGHMHSPPLTLVAEGNMVAEPLHPPLSGAEPNVGRSPSEENEHGLDGQLPLFLPSPPISPAPTEPPVTEPEMIGDEEEEEEEGRSSVKRRSVDMDKMEIDTDVAPTPPPPLRRVGKRQKQQVYVLIPPAPRYVRKAKMRRIMAEGISSGPEGAGQDEELQYSHLEQLLIEESNLRLLERRCRWLDCGTILNCAAKMLAHLKNHAGEEGLQAPFFCRWAGCSRRFDAEQERDRHLEKHTVRPLPCPFAGCDRRFDKPVEVMQHEMHHQSAEHGEPLVHKRTCQPIVPAIPARLGLPPLRLPAHRVIPRRVAKYQIPADRHAIVGPWVLWNIFSPVELNMRKQNASMRGRPTGQVTDYSTDGWDRRRGDYDFLLAHSSYPAKDARLDDLDSVQVTLSAARGLTLWGTGAGDNTDTGRNGCAQTTGGEEGVADWTLMREGA